MTFCWPLVKAEIQNHSFLKLVGQLENTAPLISERCNRQNQLFTGPSKNQQHQSDMICFQREISVELSVCSALWINRGMGEPLLPFQLYASMESDTSSVSERSSTPRSPICLALI